MAANIVVTGVAISPNPVECGKEYTISTQIEPAIYVLGDNTCRLVDSDGAYISAPDSIVYLLGTGVTGECLADSDGACLEIE